MNVQTAEIQWLDLDALAAITILAGGRRVRGHVGTWSVECPGEQLIEIRFHHATPVNRLRVVSSEAEQSCTQEITISVSSQRGERHREVARRQFRFSPHGATDEIAECALRLLEVSAIHVRIVPRTDGHPAVVRVSDVRVAATS